MRVAVVGASGLLGRASVAALLAAGHDVVALSRGARPTQPQAGVTWRRVDATRPGPALAAALAGCDAAINLVGVKRDEPGQDFAAAHVDAARALAGALREAGGRRLIHVSVAGARPDRAGPYMATKLAGEREVMSSGLDWTILRPGPVVGPGDDVLRGLAATIRHAALFPAPAGGRAPLQPIWADDVAVAIAAALARPAAVGRAYDLVGPERLELRAWIRRVAVVLGLPTWVLPCPAPLLRAAAWLLERTPAPPATRAQLEMLTEGLVGDPGPMQTELGVTPRALTADAIAAATAGVGPLFGVSLRLRRGDEAAFLGPWSPAARRLVWLVPLAIALIAGAGLVTDHVWWRMLAANAAMVPLCLVLVPLPWRALLRPRPRALAGGLLAAAALLPAGWLVSQVLFDLLPETRAQVEAVYGWVALLPAWAAAALLPAIALGEEVVWRGAVAFGVAARAGPWWGVFASAAAFAAAHVSLGVPVLVAAAAGAGFFWAWLGLKTRSLLAVLVCHVVWDAAVAALRLY